MPRKNLKKRGHKVTRRPQLQRFKRVFQSADIAAKWQVDLTLRQNMKILGLAADINAEAAIKPHAAARLGIAGATFVDLDEVQALAQALVPVEAPRKPADWLPAEEVAYLRRLTEKCVGPWGSREARAAVWLEVCLGASDLGSHGAVPALSRARVTAGAHILLTLRSNCSPPPVSAGTATTTLPWVATSP